MEIAVGGRRTAGAGCDDGEPSRAGAVSDIIERSRVLYHVLFSQSLNQARPLPPTTPLDLFVTLTGAQHCCTFSAAIASLSFHSCLVFTYIFPLAYTIRNSPHPSLPSATRLCALPHKGTCELVVFASLNTSPVDGAHILT